MMDDTEKGKEELIAELNKVRQEFADLGNLFERREQTYWHDLASSERELSQSRTDLAISEEQYRTLVETLPLGIVEDDVNGIITLSNGAHNKICGYGKGELIGKPVCDLLSSETEKKRATGTSCIFGK